MSARHTLAGEAAIDRQRSGAVLPSDGLPDKLEVVSTLQGSGHGRVADSRSLRPDVIAGYRYTSLCWTSPFCPQVSPAANRSGDCDSCRPGKRDNRIRNDGWNRSHKNRCMSRPGRKVFPARESWLDRRPSARKSNRKLDLETDSSHNQVF